jgi:trans-o-hydroxybenzylidenepyruvate hydratase-aldolase
MEHSMLRANDMRGVYAIMPTPSTDDAAEVDAVATIEMHESARLVDCLVRDGVNGVVILGTTGEIATITPTEYHTFVDCILSTVRDRVPVFVGCTALGTHEIVERARFAQSLGAAGIMLGLPMWQPLTTEMAVNFYAGISAALPALPIMVYANSRAFRNDFGVELWRGLAECAPTVISAKFSNPATFVACHEASQGRINLMPHDSAALQYDRLVPGAVTACWSTSSSMGPEPSLAMMNALLAGDYARAEAVTRDLHWAGETIRPFIRDEATFTTYNIQIEKTRFSTSGYCRPGPIRPPYGYMPPQIISAAHEVGRRWAQLRRNKYLSRSSETTL